VQHKDNIKRETMAGVRYIYWTTGSTPNAVNSGYINTNTTILEVRGTIFRSIDSLVSTGDVRQRKCLLILALD
jgi:hypothetical protein